MSLKDNIIHEAMKLFSLNGYLGTGINEILQATGSSKGGLYNHFSSKEELFFAVLAEAQSIWRRKVLFGLDEIDSPFEKIIRLLKNYSDRYLKDGDIFPGGCIFITFSVELDDQLPHLAAEVNKGFVGLKKLMKRYLDESKTLGEVAGDVDTKAVTEMIFTGMLGASVLYGVDKSSESLDLSVKALIDYLQSLKINIPIEFAA